MEPYSDCSDSPDIQRLSARIAELERENWHLRVEGGELALVLEQQDHTLTKLKAERDALRSAALALREACRAEDGRWAWTLESERAAEALFKALGEE